MIDPSSWKLVVVSVASEEAEVVADWMWQQGAVAVEEQRSAAHRVDLRTSAGDDPELFVSELHARAQASGIDIVTRIDAVDRGVADSWRRHAQPVDVTGTLRVVPAWLGRERSSDVLIEPGDVFGLGNHPTTIGTLRRALSHVGRSMRVLDAGCGSGVLSIVMAKERGASVTAFDIAPSTTSVVSHNCDINNVENVYVVDGSSDIASSSMDVVLANILAPTLIELSGELVRACKPTATIILGGMRLDQWPRVQQAYPGWNEIDREVIEGWLTVVLRRS